MKNAQNPDHVSLGTVLDWLKEGRFLIPNFQREFEWEPWDIRDLVRSIFLDYYIGSLLLWKGKTQNFVALSCEPVYGFTGTQRREYIVLDGQQRLTAMYYAFVGPNVPPPRRLYRAHFLIRVDRLMAEEYDDAFTYEWTSKRLQTKLADRDALYAEHLFPCAVIGSDDFELPNWLQGYKHYWQGQAAAAASAGNDVAEARATLHAEQAHEFGRHVRELTQQYQISFNELDEELPIDKVCDIFTQLNTKGVRLDVFDLMNALLTPKQIYLKDLWHAAEDRLDFVDTNKMNVYVLQVMSILRQAYCSPKYLYFLIPGAPKPIRHPDGTRDKIVLIETDDEFVALWHRAVDALERATALLRHPQEFGAVSSKYLPYASILPAFAALQADLSAGPAHLHFGGQRKIRQWYWASVFTYRYSGSVESTSTRDFLDVRAWIAEDAAEPAPIREFKATFRNLDLRKETNTGSSVYKAIFNLLVLGGARDWSSGTIPAHDALDDHHIVPASWDQAGTLGGNAIHSILNRTPLTSDTNRKVIGNRLPNAYLPVLIAQNGERSVRAMLETHFVSPAAFDILLRDPFTATDYEQFLTERQRTILDAIEDLLIKERINLPPNLRALDAEVEAVELRVRRMIDEALGGDASLLPPHVSQKVSERIQAALRKNPALDDRRLALLEGKLEYCDLRELQDVIMGKPTWPRFEPRFVSKETLGTRFNQLAELRNGLRHSRTVDEITRKDGEAAILWFNQLLGKEVPAPAASVSIL